MVGFGSTVGGGLFTGLLCLFLGVTLEPTESGASLPSAVHVPVAVVCLPEHKVQAHERPLGAGFYSLCLSSGCSLSSFCPPRFRGFPSGNPVFTCQCYESWVIPPGKVQRDANLWKGLNPPGPGLELGRRDASSSLVWAPGQEVMSQAGHVMCILNINKTILTGKGGQLHGFHPAH